MATNPNIVKLAVTSKTVKRYIPRALIFAKFCVPGEDLRINNFWLVSIPLKHISQLGWLFPIYGKMKNVPNHQPVLWFGTKRSAEILFKGQGSTYLCTSSMQKTVPHPAPAKWRSRSGLRERAHLHIPLSCQTTAAKSCRGTFSFSGGCHLDLNADLNLS